MKLTKENVPFLAEAMDKMHLGKGNASKPISAAEPGEITGDMTIPKPVELNVDGTMTEDDYKKCSLIMAVCTNMVQQTITNAALDSGVQVADAIRNMNAWVTGFVTFPFPFFTFKTKQSDSLQKQNFSLKVDPEVIESIINIKNVAGLKDAVMGALKASGGEIVNFSKQKRDFNYFGVITAYNSTEISTRVVKYSLNMENTDAKALCVTYANTTLDSRYETYEFVGDKYMMIKMQEAIQEKLIENISLALLEFIDEFYQQQLSNYRTNIKKIISGTLK